MASWWLPEKAITTQVATVGMALGDVELVAVLDGAADLVDVGEVDLRVDAAAQVQPPTRHTLPGAFTVAEQALDWSAPTPQFGGGDGRTAVVVRVQAQDDRVDGPGCGSSTPDRIGVHIRGGHLDRRRQVDDQRLVGGGRDDLGTASRPPWRRTVRCRCTTPGSTRTASWCRALLLLLQHQMRAASVAILTIAGLSAQEHHPPLQHRRRIVEVHNHIGRALAGLEGALDQFGAALFGEYLDGDVVRDRTVLDDLADEVEIGLARRRGLTSISL